VTRSFNLVSALTAQNTRITLGPEPMKGYFKFNLPAQVASITSIRQTIRAKQ
jgi:hypothetical protein